MNFEVKNTGENANGISELFAAIGKCQYEFPALPKSAKGQAGGGRFNYVPLDQIIEGMKPQLASYGVTFAQLVHSVDKQSALTLVVTGHGAMVSSTYCFTYDRNPQDAGKQITYARRYQLTAFFGIVGDEDADSDSVEENKRKYENKIAEENAGKVASAQAEHVEHGGTREGSREGSGSGEAEKARAGQQKVRMLGNDDGVLDGRGKGNSEQVRSAVGDDRGKGNSEQVRSAVGDVRPSVGDDRLESGASSWEDMAEAEAVQAEGNGKLYAYNRDGNATALKEKLNELKKTLGWTFDQFKAYSREHSLFESGVDSVSKMGYSARADLVDHLMNNHEKLKQ